MNYRTAFLTLLTVFFFSILALVLISAPLVKAAEQGEAQTTPYTDPSMAPARSGCSSMFEILDANQDRYITKNEATKSAEATATLQSRDRDLDGRLSFEEFCAEEKSPSAQPFRVQRAPD